MTNTNDTNGANKPNDENIIYKELSYRVMECAYEVHNVLGPGFPETIYEEAMVRELKRRQISHETQKRVEVSYKGEKIGEFRLDLIIENKVILELKAVGELSKLFEAQLYSYLKATQLKLGILINFGSRRVESRRVVN